jgi:hypothetical protein
MSPSKRKCWCANNCLHVLNRAVPFVTQHNDIQHNDIQHNDIQHNDIQHNDIQHNDISINGAFM